jgi:dTMP kinase
MNADWGVFVTFEGIEGSGKSTQSELLLAGLLERRIPAKAVHEPGGTKIGQSIRDVLLDPENADMTSETELLLYEASRAQLVRAVILPALRSGRVVVCDRYADSTIAYQSFGRGISRERVQDANQVATAGLTPRLTVLLDVAPEVGLARVGGSPDRIESEPLDFHERVRDGFLSLATECPERFLVLDGTRPSEALASAVLERVLALV